MTDTAIRVEDLGKKYLIGRWKHRHDTLRDQIMDNLRNLMTGRCGTRRQKNEFWALKDVSFEVGQGESVGIIGHNGAGKSTLLKLLSRITQPTAGEAMIYGRVGSLLEVGTGFHPELTGRENIYLNGAIIGMRKEEIDRCFDAIVDFAEIEKFIDMPVKRFSSGMYVRLAFSVSAHLRPEILMIDEVLSVGDLQFQRKCLNYAEELKQSGATILFVSHNMFSVKSICKRVIYLSQGRMKADGSPQQVIPMFEKESRAETLFEVQGGRDIGGGETPVQILWVELFDESGTARSIFDHGERMRVRVGYIASQTISDPNFVVALIRSDNVACCNFCTGLDDFDIPELNGTGTIEVLTPPMKLVSESYTIHILVWDQNFQRMYCFHKSLNFHIRHHLYSTHFGVFHEKGEWSIPEGERDRQTLNG